MPDRAPALTADLVYGGLWDGALVRSMRDGHEDVVRRWPDQARVSPAWALRLDDELGLSLHGLQIRLRRRAMGATRGWLELWAQLMPEGIRPSWDQAQIAYAISAYVTLADKLAERLQFSMEPWQVVSLVKISELYAIGGRGTGEWILKGPAGCWIFSPDDERIDHCGDCHAENPPQQLDLCPACGAEGTLISTWGEGQAERYRSRERYAQGEILGEADIAGRHTTVPVLADLGMDDWQAALQAMLAATEGLDPQEAW